MDACHLQMCYIFSLAVLCKICRNSNILPFQGNVCLSLQGCVLSLAFSVSLILSIALSCSLSPLLTGLIYSVPVCIGNSFVEQNDPVVTTRRQKSLMGATDKCDFFVSAFSRPVAQQASTVAMSVHWETSFKATPGSIFGCPTFHSLVKI